MLMKLFIIQKGVATSRLTYQGWSLAILPPKTTVRYCEIINPDHNRGDNLKKKLTVQITKFCCLELVPGMVRCANVDVTGVIVSTTEANTSECADLILQSNCLLLI